MEPKVARQISASSMLGRFVRKCKLEYVKLEFEEAGLLWSLVQVSRGPGQESSGMSPMEDVDGSLALHIPEYLDGVSIGTSIGNICANVLDCYSRDDIQKLCRTEVEQFQSTQSLTSE